MSSSVDVRSRSLLLFSLAALALASACSHDVTTPATMQPGTTDFTSTSPSQSANTTTAPGAAQDSAGNATGSLPPSTTVNGAAGPTTPGAPMGRVADVEEADIYKIDQNRLFYLNTYRGFLAYDVSDATKPKLLGRLPVYGYPVEMFVKGTTVYALLRDVLYLTQDNGHVSFQRRDVSQLVTIDVSDPGAPKVLKTIDIVGQLREGVSRKIDDTLYVVSYVPQSYWYGWDAPGATPPKEQAWVYSFNVADATNPSLVQSLKIFEGGSVQYWDNNSSYYRTFSDVQIAATSNALMVVENWWVSASTSSGSGPSSGCGSYESGQLAITSIIDVSDPTGKIRLHTKFQTAGQLTDQFKQTYVFDSTAKTGTYFGVFARQVYASNGCVGAVHVQNSLESWDVTDGTKPSRLARLDFGDSQETVRATAFDLDRQVVFAVTAQNIDPLYAISFADRNNPKVLSKIAGLSGSMSVFRTVEQNEFLMGIGQDTSATCTGFQNGSGIVGTNIAVSLIDVRDLANIRLVQRGCVAVKNAQWVSSQITWNMDQAHKMIGMFSDATANVVTVPVSYYQRTDEKDWYWYGYQTAVGIMSWDLTKYDDTKPPEAQTVLQNWGTFVHPNGEVQRSILFTHDGTAAGVPSERMMINLSDTHMSVASIQDLSAPKLLANVEIAPYETAVFRFGDYVVEEIQSQPYYGWTANQDRTEFRVVAAGGDLDQKDPVATFANGQVIRAFKQGENLLVAIRYVQSAGDAKDPTTWTPPVLEAQVYDLTDPTHPRTAGKATLPSDVVVYYGYWCGGWYWGPWSFYGTNDNIVSTTSGLVIVGQNWQNGTYTTRLVSLDLTNPDAPVVATKTVATASSTDVWWSSYGLVADPVQPDGFYLTYRTYVGEQKIDGNVSLSVFKDYAQRWALSGGAWTGGATINLPGQLTRTFANADGKRMFVSQDFKWGWVSDATATSPYAGHTTSTLRLSLLEQTSLAGRTVASLLDSETFDDTTPSTMALEGQTLMLVAHKQSGYYYNYGYPVAAAGGVGVATADLVAGAPPAAPADDADSDRLITFDLSGGKFASLYDAPTGMYNSDVVGVHDGRLLLSLSGDGFLVVDVADASKPRGVRFVRTLGWADNVEFAGNDVYVSSGYFGVQHFGVADAPALLPTAH
ncbi:MAG TPA: beta-propeller domain-containing protein [Polyangia bacterium]|nr:beta-propeller domain-containing protein [Polyangia bacterium]